MSPAKKSASRETPSAHPSTVFNLRIPVDLDRRLGKAARQMDLGKNDIARNAIRALVEAIEKSDYRVSWPPIMQIGRDSKTIRV